MQARTTSVLTVTAAGARSPAATFSRFVEALGLRHAADAWLIFATLIFPALVFLSPNLFMIGIGIWWLLNTVSHNFIHQPFFKTRATNRVFAFHLSLITLIPQRLWRDKHLAHHADHAWRFRLSAEAIVESAAVLLVWIAAFVASWHWTLFSLLPGFFFAMALCALHGYFEHAAGTTSYYGALYNRLFFNDGFHVEHHTRPALHWTSLPQARENARASKWPAVFRWCAWFNLNRLEGVVVHSPFLQRWVVAAHVRALAKVTAGLPAPSRIAIVGGGLFPRTALVAHALWPSAHLTIIDANAAHLENGRRWLRGDETLICARVRSETLPEADLVIVPLAFDEDKRPLYQAPKSGSVIVHDWLWKARRQSSVKRSAIASILLLKRVNLVRA